MNKSDLILCLSKKSNISKELCKQVLDNLLVIMRETMQKGEKIKLVNFGVFEAAYRKSKVVRMPKSVKTYSLPERFIPIFRCSPRLKQSFNLNFD